MISPTETVRILLLLPTPRCAPSNAAKHSSAGFAFSGVFRFLDKHFCIQFQMATKENFAIIYLQVSHIRYLEAHQILKPVQLPLKRREIKYAVNGKIFKKQQHQELCLYSMKEEL